jgi:hypothetical protein
VCVLFVVVFCVSLCVAVLRDSCFLFSCYSFVSRLYHVRIVFETCLSHG